MTVTAQLHRIKSSVNGIIPRFATALRATIADRRARRLDTHAGQQRGSNDRGSSLAELRLLGTDHDTGPARQGAGWAHLARCTVRPRKGTNALSLAMNVTS
jgi:hypothetical protein